MSVTANAPTLQHKVAPVAGFKVLDEEKGIVSTIVSVTGIVDEVKDRIVPGSYEKTLIDRTPKGVWSHDWDTPVSKTVTVEELMPGDPRLPRKQRNGEPWPKAAGGLLVETQFNLDTQRGGEAFSDVKFFGEEQEWSIGYNVPVGGYTIDRKTGVREITEIELFEYSPVLFGAMPLTVTTDVKTAQAAIREIESKEATKPHDFRGEDDEKCQACDEVYDHEMHIGSPKWKEANPDEEEKVGDAAEEEKEAEPTVDPDAGLDPGEVKEGETAAGETEAKDVFTTSPTGDPLSPQFGRPASGGTVVTPGAGGSEAMTVVANHSACPEDRPYGVESGGNLIACCASREEADGLVGAAKAAQEAISAKRAADEEEAKTQLGRKLLLKGVPVADGAAMNEEDGWSYVESYTSSSGLAQELDAGLDALQGAIGRGDQETADALWLAVDRAADALLEALGVNDTDDPPAANQALTGDGWNPECDPGTMAQAVDACVDLGYAAWQAGNFAEAAALVFAADCSVDELLEWWGLGDDQYVAVPSSYYDEWAADLPEAVKDPAALQEKLDVLRQYGTKEGRVLSGGNANAVVDAVSALIAVLDGAQVQHPWKQVSEAGNNSDQQPEGTVEGVTVVPNDTNTSTLKGAEGAENEQAAGDEISMKDLSALRVRALKLRA